MRRYISRHADSDADGSIEKQIGKFCRKDFRLLLSAIIVRLPINCFFINIYQQFLGNLSQPRFGIAIGGGRIAVNGAEVALSVNERVAERKILRHANQGVVNGSVAMRMVFSQRVTDDIGAFSEFSAMSQAIFPHRPKNAALDGL